MKRILTLLFLVGIFVSGIQAQAYTVVEIKGTIDSLDNRGRAQKVIRLNQSLNPSTQIRINTKSRIKLVDQKNQKMFTFENEGSGKISKFILEEQCTIRNLSKQYLTYLLNRMRHMPEMCHTEDTMRDDGTIHRGDTLHIDSLDCEMEKRNRQKQGAQCDSTQCQADRDSVSTRKPIRTHLRND